MDDARALCCINVIYSDYSAPAILLDRYITMYFYDTDTHKSNNNDKINFKISIENIQNININNSITSFQKQIV